MNYLQFKIPQIILGIIQNKQFNSHLKFVECNFLEIN